MNETYHCAACSQDFPEAGTYIDDDGHWRFRPHNFATGPAAGYECHGSRAIALSVEAAAAEYEKLRRKVRAALNKP